MALDMRREAECLGRRRRQSDLQSWSVEFLVGASGDGNITGLPPPLSENLQNSQHITVNLYGAWSKRSRVRRSASALLLVRTVYSNAAYEILPS
ncbi:hypothetical protein ABIE78_000368 [Sinorhizobium fredii]